MDRRCTVGLDYGTNSVRAVVVDIRSGEELGTHVWNYRHGEDGVVLDPNDPLLARQHPQDYIDGLEGSITGALQEARAAADFEPSQVVGIGVDTTGSTPLPVDSNGEPLAFKEQFEGEVNALAWLWKDHTAHEEAETITRTASDIRPEYVAKYGGTYSSEWFWSKLWHCLKVAPDVFKAAHTWIEIADWIPAVLSSTTAPDRVKRGICAAGHKAIFNPPWGGYPDVEFLSKLDGGLAQVRRTLPDEAHTVAEPAGTLSEQWAEQLGLPENIPVAVGAFDAHLGAIGSGIQPGTLVKTIGTSTCDMMVAPLDRDLPDIPGLCGIVPESILPGHYGLEAGQSAVGDIYNWFVNNIQPGGKEAGSHEELTQKARALQPGESGLLGLDWHNGNRTVLVDQRLTGALVGMTLHTRPEEIYRALIESTAYGARVIMERFEEYGVDVDRVVTCGGIPPKNPLVMQILADVLGHRIEISSSEQTCALGSAMAGAVVAGEHEDFAAAQEAMTGTRELSYSPTEDGRETYNRLYNLYRQLHDNFGAGEQSDLSGVMKELLNIQEEVKES